MKYIWSYIKPFKKELVFIFLGMLMFSVVNLGLPTMLAMIIDNALIPGDLSNLYFFLAIMLFISCLGIAGQIFGSYFISKLSTMMTMNLRNDLFKKMLKLSHHEFQDYGVPSLTNRMTSDAFILMQFTQMTLRTLATAPVMIIISIYMITRTSPELGLYVFPVAPMIVAMIIIIAWLTLPISRAQQKTLDSINRILRENITGTRVVRAFNREQFFEERFEEVNHTYRQYSSRLFKTMAITPSLFSLIMNITIILIVWFGAGFAARGSVQVGTLVAFIEYVWLALFSLTIFANIFMMYPRAVVSAGRLDEVMHTPITVPHPENPIMETDGSGRLEFNHVDFAYPDADEPVLRDISFSSKAGETIAFIGSTGSGKSTIVKLIPRFYDVSSGEIKLDGIDIRDLDLQVLRSKIGYTPQKANLFSGQIATNLRYGKFDADEEDMDHATSIAQASEFINRLATRYYTELTEGGTNLSGGQRQRLSIARSIIGDREIYIFDDSFSALDYKTDAAVRQALKEETKDATTIIIAQRVGTIINADQIIVLDHGQIAAKGTHKELLKSSPLYYEIASSQLTKEELEYGE
ncbi:MULTISPECIES: ABC transporter ATP-binding protein [Aerococcus]|uniref:ABC transporter ATP-binding protein n=2 Tax=Aerococcus TaxID=1375 RepID=A0A5N1BKZ3_9LACT|nr:MULTISPECIES: ABC transporter ATP-binding protein [Aerococcus]KAA9240010.1 ABC transporter ATP-binding protein [Aerococcus urinae]KAA9291441.1 ABC transporter ATP-binding protein [Aerococcus mictus]MBU5609973.1 ABC transporter ATP-binding protein/permease [Aerococcus urinae]MDK6372033.1 ABC transporter ATP-binding protein [Aerococcus urinae]MDK6450132.1 ABC transporter ATP-binding protein [Aerococcus urinae]